MPRIAEALKFAAVERATAATLPLSCNPYATERNPDNKKDKELTIEKQSDMQLPNTSRKLPIMIALINNMAMTKIPRVPYVTRELHVNK